MVMITVNVKPLAQRLMHPILGLFFGQSASPQSVGQAQTAWQTAQMPQEIDNDTESAFLASIADLPEAERAKRIQRRAWYAQMATRQGIDEVEWRAEQYQRTGDVIYRK